MTKLRDFKRNTMCPFCGYVCTHAGETMKGGKPKDGNLCLCLKCGELGEFKRQAKGGLVPLLGADLSEANRDPDIKKLRAAWRAMVAATGGVK